MSELLPLEIPETYFDLIQKVGKKGKYQANVFIIFALTWAISAFLLLGTSFLFMNPKFDCEAHGIKTDNCEEIICAMDPQLWHKYLEEPQVNSLATEFGPFLCDKASELYALRMSLYVGAFIGYVTFLFITDNFGRKYSLLLTWSVTMIGVFILCAAPNMIIATLGLFLAGTGCESALRINMAVLGQIVDYYRRQSYSIALEIAFGFSGILVGVMYWVFRQWREITIFFCAIPGTVILILLIFYFEETPKFLVTKKGLPETVKRMNKIGKINTNKQKLITLEDVQQVYENEECGSSSYEFIMTPWHLFKFKSLRKHTICCSLTFFLITYLYYGPFIIIDGLGINPFLAQIIISLSELLAYPFAFCFIHKLPRVKSGIISLSISAILTGILIFVTPSTQCEGCWERIIQTVLIFASRFIVSFYMSILFLFMSEVFPLRARGMGYGIASAAGAIASSSGQFIFEKMEEKGINPMILFTIISIFAAIVLSFEDDSLNKPLENEIEEIKALKESQKEKLRSQNHQINDTLIQ